jgi:chaperone required for assembly of F1-ATPase
VKRFWKDVELAGIEGAWQIMLDGRPVRTPARALLQIAPATLAAGVAAEWREVGEKVDPRAMPLTGLTNAAIDHASLNPEAFARTFTGYAETDLLYYRAEGPEALVDRQAQAWDPMLGWARRRFDVDFRVTQGIMHVAQPAFTVERLSSFVLTLDPFRLAGLSPLVTIGGSLIAALAMLEGQVSAAAAWEAVSIDERWQLEQWGADADAQLALENRRRDFLSAARFLSLREV